MGDLIQKLVAEAQGHANVQRWQAAADCLIKATQHQPNDPGLWVSLGEVYRMANAIGPARQAYENALRIAPRFAHAHLLLANALDLQGESVRALNHALKALEIEPRYDAAAITATNLLLKTGDVDGSVQMGQRAVQLSPRSPLSWLNFGNALLHKPEMAADAEHAFRQAVTFAPDFAAAHNSFATTLTRKEDHDGAIEHLRKAALLDPNFFPSWANLAQAYSSVGLIADSLDVFRKALAMAPHAIQLWKAYLFTLSYTDSSDEQILQEHQRFFELMKINREQARGYTVDRQQSVIRIGYLSPDFRDHPIGYFVEPLLASHDRSRFDVFCYETIVLRDAMTKRLQSSPATWRDISNMSDDEAMRTIRSDKLDVLIDLAGHTLGGRLEVFARRAAPIQLSYLGYPMTTGLVEMDYRLTDAIADPPCEDESGYVEQLVRMPNCFCCFSPPQNAPAVGRLPAERNEFVTFGSLQAMAKVNDRVIELWAKVMAAVPNSRLLMVRNTLTPSTQDRLLRLFSSHGIDPARITFNRKIETAGGHLTFYNQIDVSLDTFPFTGHTTACQSLFMGVPIVTLSGPSHRHRLVATVLTHVGKPEWITKTPEEFVRIAGELAGDLSALVKVRENLRAQMLASPLCDAAGFTREFEAKIADLVRGN